MTIGGSNVSFLSSFKIKMTTKQITKINKDENINYSEEEKYKLLAEYQENLEKF